MNDDYGTDSRDSGLFEQARALAHEFVTKETPFHLGALPTEGSHPITRNFSDTIERDTVEGVKLLLAVDGDLAPVARRVFRSEEYSRLVAAILESARGRRRICFSGCGSTGRLAMLLEEMWRQFWEDQAGVEPGSAEAAYSPREQTLNMANLACSIMTGGDRALVRSVESFEDYPAFGARQVADMELGEGDLLIAITEGGETPSVLGSVDEGLRRGCRVFLVFNNPAQLLRERVDRSRRAIDNPHVTVLDLCTGAMALSGSTRMQATTMGMLVIGAAMEEGLSRLTGDNAIEIRRESRAGVFADLVQNLNSSPNLRSMAGLAERERQVYERGGLVTYFTSHYLLDLFCDTSERTPTFMLPPFRPSDDHSSAQSWAYAKDPTRSSISAWHSMLRRSPRGLDWGSADYEALGAPAVFSDRPPALGVQEIARYAVGSEPDDARPGTHPNWWLHLTGPGWATSYVAEADTLRVGGARDSHAPSTFSLDVSTEDSPINLWQHLLMKLLYNTVSTATMGLMGRVRGNWMIQLDPTNKKLIDRGSRIIEELGGIDYEPACAELYVSILSRSRLSSEGGETTTSPVVAALQRLGVWGP